MRSFFHAENYLIMFKGYDLSPFGHPYNIFLDFIALTRDCQAILIHYKTYFSDFAFALSSSAFFAS